MKIGMKVIDDIMILELHGKIGIGEGIEELRSAIDSSIEKGFKKVIFDMKNVIYFDSTGLGELVRSYTAIKKAGGEILLCNLTNKVDDLLRSVKFFSVFKVKDTLESAIEEFREGLKPRNH